MKSKTTKIFIGIIIIAAILAVETYFWMSYEPIEENPGTDTKINNTDKPQTNPDIENPDSEGAMPGFKAPEIELNNINDKKVRLSDYKGKPVVITFWRVGNPESKEQLTKLDQLNSAKTQQDDFVILAVNYKEEDVSYEKYKEKIRKAVAEEEYGFDILLDNERKAAADYNISALPTTFLIDSSGIINNMWTSVVDGQEIIDSLNLVKE